MRRPGAQAAPAWLARPGFVWWSLGLLTLAGAVLRFMALRYQPYVTFDGTEYVRFADALMRGEGFASVFAPGYPLLAGLARVLTPDRVGAAVAVSMLAGIALPPLVWALARGSLGERGALLPALACALHPELARHSAVTMSESAYVGMLYLGLAALAWSSAPATARARATLAAAVGGLALGASYAIRPEGLVCAVALAVAGGHAVAAGRRSLRSVIVPALACALVVVACVTWYRATLGGWTLTPKTAALHEAALDWRAAEPKLGAPAVPAVPFAERALGSVRAWPANAWTQARALLWTWPWPLLALSIWGLVRHRGIETAALVYLPLLPFLGLSQQGRFALATIPALAILASRPLLFERGRGRRLVAAALAVFGAIACAWALSDAFRTPFDGPLLTDRRAGEWLAGVAQPGDGIVDRKPFVAFYAGGQHRVLADGSYDALLDDAVTSGARWLVLEEYVVRQMRPQLAPLLDSADSREREMRVELAYARADAGQGSVAIFRVLRPGEAKTGRPPVVEMVGFPSGTAAPRTESRSPAP